MSPCHHVRQVDGLRATVDKLDHPVGTLRHARQQLLGIQNGLLVKEQRCAMLHQLHLLTGHSHVFERSKPLKNQYGRSSEFNKSVHWPQSSSGRYDKSANSCPYLFSTSNTEKNGVIYVVNGVGGGPGTLRYGVTHPVMEYSLAGQAGSFYFEIDGNRLDAKFINEEGNVKILE